MEKKIGKNGEGFWDYERMGLEAVVKEVERKKCERKVWTGPKKRDSVL